MSRFTGPQYRGASRDARILRRQEAEVRQESYAALLANGPADVRIYRDRTIRPRLGRQFRLARGGAA